MLPDETPIHEELPVLLGPITEVEVRQAAKRLRGGKAAGRDKLPPEFWKAAVGDGETALSWITAFCNKVWTQASVPDAWRKAKVRMIYKKGDPASCDNYRPICLLPIGYKVFAAILLGRLKDAGAESKIWKTQFGFRSGRGTADAIFLARRVIEDAWATRDGETLLLALDWAKAFDSVSPTALAASLRRFGLPDHFVRVVASIYQDRTFVVSEFDETSAEHSQRYGICQGCPLSPFLFTIVMTTLLTDAHKMLHTNMGELPGENFVRELVYADDTLLIDSDPRVVQALMNAVETCGMHYGLKFNWQKVELLRVRSGADILNASGAPVACKSSIAYLGTRLAADGRIGSELSSRIGAAGQDFKVLNAIWAHSTLSRTRKLRIFNACIVSKLMYSLFAGCLNKCERRRLDGFHARCLRKIYRVPPAYVSRVSNAAVFAMAGQRPLSDNLMKRQMLFMGQLARRPDEDPVRRSVFEPAGFDLRPPSGPRRRGRPRQSWGSMVMRNCLSVAGSREALSAFFCRDDRAAASWESAVKTWHQL